MRATLHPPYWFFILFYFIYVVWYVVVVFFGEYEDVLNFYAKTIPCILMYDDDVMREDEAKKSQINKIVRKKERKK